MRMDSVRQMIDFSLERLGVNRAYLGGLLGVSERTISEWQNKQIGDLPPKGKRLQRLVEVVNFIEHERGILPTSEIMNVLQNGRIPMDGDDEDSNSISLIGYITAFPEEHAWIANARSAMDDYFPPHRRAQEE
jgi:hypothetical protein